jgi:hypothetical protein
MRLRRVYGPSLMKDIAVFVNTLGVKSEWIINDGSETVFQFG